MVELTYFRDHREVIGWAAIGDDTILQFPRIHGFGKRDVGNFCSPGRHPQAAFSRLRANSPSLILFLDRHVGRVIPVSGSLQAMGQESVDFLGRNWSLGGVSGVLLYLLGFAGEIFVVTSIYLVMPVGRLSLRHALIGGVTAAVLWELTRHGLVWYFATLSQVGLVYGSLTTAIAVLLSLDLAATLLLLGAQVISEYERVGSVAEDTPPDPLSTH